MTSGKDPRVPVADKRATINPKAQADSEGGLSENQSSVTTADQPMVETKDVPVAPTGLRKSEARCRERREWIRFGVEFLTLLVVLWYAITNSKMYREMVAANNQATGRFEDAERPWVAVGGIDIVQELESGRQMVVALKEKNGGLSPALKENMYGEFKTRLVKSKETEKSLQTHPHCEQPQLGWDGTSGNILLPGESTDTLPMRTENLGASEITFLKSGQMGTPENPGPSNPVTLRLYLIGCIDYFDQFRRTHRTNFCYIYEPATFGESGRDFRQCFIGNSAN